MYKVGDMVEVISGDDTGKKATVLLDWGNRKWMCEVVGNKALTILHEEEIAPENADNETYLERVLESMDKYL